MLWPERFDERLHIFAHGEKFDVDAFLGSSTLRPDFVWRREAPLTSGVEFLLGDGREIRPSDQEELVVDYLKTHRDELRFVGQFPGVETFIVGLVHISPLQATGFSLGPSPRLMRQALEIGILPRYYGSIEGLRVESEPRIRRFPKGKVHPYERWEHTPLWRAIEKAVSELINSGDLIESTYRERTVGSICDAINRRKKSVSTQLKSNTHS